MRDLIGGLVGKGERADARWRNVALFDEKANPLDEAVGLPGPGPCEHEQRARQGLDGFTLRVRWGRRVGQRESLVDGAEDSRHPGKVAPGALSRQAQRIFQATPS